MGEAILRPDWNTKCSMWVRNYEKILLNQFISKLGEDSFKAGLTLYLDQGLVPNFKKLYTLVSD